MTATVDHPTPEHLELADVTRRVLGDLTIPAADVPLVIASLTLGRPFIAAPLAARPELAHLRAVITALRMRHRPVPIRDGHDHQVCAADRNEWPCPDGAVLWAVEG